MRSVFVSLVLASFLSGQSAPGVCQGFNEALLGTTAFNVVGGESLAIQLAPTSDTLIGGVDFFTTSLLIPGGMLEIRREDPATGLPGDLLAQGFATLGAGGPTWFSIYLNALIVLRAGNPYWIVFITSPVLSSSDLGTEPAGPDVFVWAQTTGGVFGPPQGGGQFKVRLLSNPCIPPTTPLAQATFISTGCAGLVGVPPALVPVGSPALGTTTFSLRVLGPSNAQTALFWTLTPDLAGVPLGFGCRLHLNLQELLSLTSLGLEPWFTGTIGVVGSVDFVHPIPAAVSAAGTRLIWQAVVLDPAGPPIAGIPMTLTNALEVLIGY